LRRVSPAAAAPASLARALLIAAGALLAVGAGALLACGAEPPTPAPAAAPEAAAPPRAEAKRLGLWVPCEGSQRILEHPARAADLIALAHTLGVTDLFVQVYRGGRAWYDASLADAAPYRALEGDDPLRALVRAAHARDLRVHAWVNVLSLGTHRDGPLLTALGRDAVQSDRDGRSLLDYPELQVPEADARFVRLGTSAVWLDPGAPGVAVRLAAVFAELVARYPELDGLHLDYIRYPDVLPFTPGARFDLGLDFGFGEASRARFREQTGLDAPFRRDSRNADAFDAWRRAQVTEVVRAIGASARAAHPDLTLSAAVWSFPDRAYLSLHQDWTRWLEEDLLSFAVPMVYTRDPRLFTLLTRANAGAAGPRAWIGIGAWLFAATPQGVATQLREARALGTGGVSLFSYDALAESPALVDVLAQQASHER
jgi:uncharacterized lipoprotein YddW (UPF0748 family)